jgi:hypothetical protein
VRVLCGITTDATGQRCAQGISVSEGIDFFNIIFKIYKKFSVFYGLEMILFIDHQMHSQWKKRLNGTHSSISQSRVYFW